MNAFSDFLKTLPSAATGLSSDSRVVQPGDIFVAIQGAQTDGRRHLAAAAERGAVGFLIEGNASDVSAPLTRPACFIPDLKSRLFELAAQFYHHPARRLRLHGVTGTNGKTSTTHFIAQLLNQNAGRSCAVLGTLGVGIPPGTLDAFGLTTPDAIALQRYFSGLLAQGATDVAMEVSSHALAQQRVQGLTFESAVLTNVTQDHLDYHGTMQAYWAAKRPLLTDYQAKHLIVNVDDPYGLQFCQDWVKKRAQGSEAAQVVGYALHFNAWHTLPGVQPLTLSNIQRGPHVVSGDCRSPWGEGRLETALVGDFNLSNVLAGLAVACVEGHDFHHILTAVRGCEPVPGRMNRVGGTPSQPLVVVDYAHTPDALAQVLQALRPYCKGQLWCVFGCGGDRDRTKRPLMLQSVLENADNAWITQDNSRTEPPAQIIADMLQGLSNHEKITIELDRRQAILQAVGQASPEDVVLIAGKGHETHQILGTVPHPFSDAQVARTALLTRN